MSAPAQDARIQQNSAPMHQPWFDLKIKVIGFSWKSGSLDGQLAEKDLPRFARLALCQLSFLSHPSLVRTFLKYPPHRHDGDEHGVFDENNNDELMVMYEPYYKSGQKSTNQ